MADAADRANERMDNDIEGRLANRMRFEGTSATECRECDEPIPEPRRQALPGVQLCIDCQSIQEARNR
jgi:phage/conjugal plasmid C-4 type zinc finger TraR family protein